ncbi:MAG: nuclear transport factor 2 family protein [Telluria sp.]
MELTNTLRAAAAGSLLALAFAAAPAFAEDNPVGATAACGPGAADSASHSPETLARAVYDIVSGPAGARKDWARMEAMFAPGALVTPTWHGKSGFLAAPQTPQQFAALNDRVFAGKGFFESEITHQVHLYGHMAHVLSSFQARNAVDGPVRGRGINSFQMLNDGKRWCILSLTWEIETPDHPVPAEFAAVSALPVHPARLAGAAPR